MVKKNNSLNAASDHEQIGEHVRIFQRGVKWYANFQNNKRQYRKSLDTLNKKEARRRALQIEAKLSSGEWKPAVERVTVAEAVEAYLSYLDTEGRSLKTMAKYRHVLGRVVALAENRNIKEIAGLDNAFLDEYRKLRNEAGAAAKTLYTESVIIRQLIRFAISRNMLASDPQSGRKLRKPKPTKQPCWTLAEIEKILDAVDEGLRAPLTLLAETGMRFGELAWLTWEDVEFGRNRLVIRPKDSWKPKTGDQRSVPLSALAKALLEKLPRLGRWVCPMPPSSVHPGTGRQWTEKRLLNGLKRALKKVGLEGKLHTFRHSFISNALIKGTPIPIVRAWVGHVDPKVIDVYTHIHDSASQDAMDKLGQ